MMGRIDLKTHVRGSMGQGKKKCSRMENSRYRHRSVYEETESHETIAVRNALGLSSSGRSGSMSDVYSRIRKRDSAPVPTIQRPPRKDSLVEYMKLSEVRTKKSTPIRTKEVSPIATIASSNIPLVSTSLPSTNTHSKPGRDQMIRLINRQPIFQGSGCVISGSLSQQYILYEWKGKRVIALHVF